MKLDFFIVDDHPIFRDGFKMFLESLRITGQVYEADSGQAFLDILPNIHVDIIFMDVNMGGIDGAQATAKALQKQPKLKVIAISSYDDIGHIDKMMVAGVDAYILKDSGREEISDAIQAVLNDKNYFSEKILEKIASKAASKARSKRSNSLITDREQQVLEQISKGLSRLEIAKELYISEKTVDKHRENLLQKTKTKNSVELVLYAIKNKLIKL